MLRFVKSVPWGYAHEAHWHHHSHVPEHRVHMSCDSVGKCLGGGLCPEVFASLRQGSAGREQAGNERELFETRVANKDSNNNSETNLKKNPTLH